MAGLELVTTTRCSASPGGSSWLVKYWFLIGRGSCWLVRTRTWIGLRLVNSVPSKHIFRQKVSSARRLRYCATVKGGSYKIAGAI